LDEELAHARGEEAVAEDAGAERAHALGEDRVALGEKLLSALAPLTEWAAAWAKEAKAAPIKRR
jgi:hypothetical protein